jgi:hypothetical protein
VCDWGYGGGLVSLGSGKANKINYCVVVIFLICYHKRQPNRCNIRMHESWQVASRMLTISLSLIVNALC